MARAAGEWERMGAAERADAVKVYRGQCMQHIRNVLLDAMSGSGASFLKDELEESLDAFSSYERMSTDPMQLIRAVRAMRGVGGGAGGCRGSDTCVRAHILNPRHPTHSAIHMAAALTPRATLCKGVQGVSSRGGVRQGQGQGQGVHVLARDQTSHRLLPAI
eukprot:7383587-Prymnesium_polylepis.1